MTAERPTLVDVVEQTSREAESQLEASLPSLRREVLSAEAPASWWVSGWRLAGASAAMLALGVIWWFARSPAPLGLEIDGTPGQAGVFIAAETEPRVLRFSEGTRVDLAAASRVQVVAVDARGSTLRLDTGAVAAKVTHLDDTRWVVEAGPYRIRVTGTEFQVAWNPATRDFALSLSEGSVEVTGPLVGTRRVGSGERLEVKAERELRLDTLTQRVPPITQPAPVDVEPAPVVITTESLDAGPPTPKKVQGPGWLELARAREWEQAWARLPATQGPLLERSSADELLLLADTARFSNHPRQAVEALVTLRRRFPKTAQEASYLLGRVRADQLGDTDAALPAFLAAFDAAPSGPLAEESLARALEIAEAARRPETRSLAERYLTAFPKGPHAAQARRLRETAAP